MQLKNPKAGALLALVCVVAVACDDGLGPGTWDATPDTTVIYSLSRPELVGEPAAYDFVQLRRVVVEAPGATGAWDIALAEQGGSFVFVPSGNFPGIESRAAIAETSNATLESLREAPGDTAAYSRGPVVARVGAVYAVRSRRSTCFTFGTGTFYGKFQVISIDEPTGSVRLAAVRNFYCNNRALVPPGT